MLEYIKRYKQTSAISNKIIDVYWRKPGVTSYIRRYAY
jgi:hypothetical protein